MRLALFNIANTLDIITTLLATGAGATELNPLMALALAHSPLTFIAAKLGIAALLSLWWARKPSHIPTICGILLLTASIWNTYVYFSIDTLVRNL